jgi:hypothetical protein
VLRHADGELEPDALVPREERQKPVGGSRAEDLDPAPRLEIAERAHEIGAGGLEQVPKPREPVTPVAHERQEVRLGRGDVERGLVAGLEPLGDERLELVNEDRAGELVGEHRREADGDGRRDVLVVERAQRLEQRQVGVERGFAEPVAAVRPAPMVEDPREVAMEHQHEVHLGSGQARGPRATARR